MIEGDDAVDFSARNIQRFGDQRFGRFIDVTELLDKGVQDVAEYLARMTSKMNGWHR